MGDEQKIRCVGIVEGNLWPKFRAIFWEEAVCRSRIHDLCILSCRTESPGRGEKERESCNMDSKVLTQSMLPSYIEWWGVGRL